MKTALCDIGFGRAARRLWRLEPGAAMLNHGSFGACPRVVLAEQNRIRAVMERHPDRFFDEWIVPRDGGSPLRAAAGEMARFLGVSGDSLAFVENATAGIGAVLASIELAPSDEILITSQQYNAVSLAVEDRCRRSGAAPVIAKVPIGSGPEEIVGRIGAAVTARTRLAVIDHITSATATLLPIEPIIADLHARGVPVLVDGAHAIGQIELDLRKLGADWYVTNAHKWLYAPKGTAVLYASPAQAPRTRPPVVSHFIDRGFPHAFDYVGTRDCSGWLASPAALRFFEDLGPQRLRAYTTELLDQASALLCGCGAVPLQGAGSPLLMRAFRLPTRTPAVLEDAARLRAELWRREKIQIAAGALDGALLLRLSGQAYVEASDFERLAAALTKHGWPGRS